VKKRIFIFSMLIIFMGCASTPKTQVVPPASIFYPALPQRPRLQFLLSISGEDDLGKRQSMFHEFIFGRDHYQLLGKPYDVASAKGKIYVMDRLYKRIVIIDLTSHTMSFLKDNGSGRLEDPAGICVSQEDIKYVADMQRKQVVAFDKMNRFLKAYGSQEIFENPVDVAVYGNSLYVVDINKEKLFILDKETGQVIKIVGGEGEFFKPSRVAVGPLGNVFVTDTFHFVIRKFSPDGMFLGTIGVPGDQIGSFARPKGMSLDKEGRLYVVDAAFENVQIFDDRGQILLFFGGPGTDPGHLYLPAGITVDYSNTAFFQKFANPDFKLEYLVYVTNMFGKNMLNVYGFGHWPDTPVPVE
jgi:DNA-binding beta-propeller fold protein YncE